MVNTVSNATSNAITQEEILRMIENFNDGAWAKNSQFYQQVMPDGNIFNPYLHRRFLPARFEKMMKSCCDRNAHPDSTGKSIDLNRVLRDTACTYNIPTMLDSIVHDIEVLSFLKRKDPLAYKERSLIFPLDECKEMFAEYIDTFQAWIVGNSQWRLQNNLRCYYVNKEYIRKLMADSSERIRTVESYKKLFEVLTEKVNLCENGKGKVTLVLNICARIMQKDYNMSPLNYNFCPATFVGYGIFLKSGAYYSMKNYLMFNMNVDHRGVKLQKLRDDLKQNKDYIYFCNEFCKEKFGVAVIGNKQP